MECYHSISQSLCLYKSILFRLPQAAIRFKIAIHMHSYIKDFGDNSAKRTGYAQIRSVSRNYIVSAELTAFRTNLCKAVTAVNRTVAARLERELCLSAALGAGRGKELTLRTRCVLALVAAGLTSLRLVLEAVICVKFLLAGGEHELLAAISAYQSFVLIHIVLPLFDSLRIIPPEGMIYANRLAPVIARSALPICA